jgi:hypothetical protein
MDEMSEEGQERTDIEAHSLDVRFTPKSGHGRAALGCPLCASKRHEVTYV